MSYVTYDFAGYFETGVTKATGVSDPVGGNDAISVTEDTGNSQHRLFGAKVGDGLVNIKAKYSLYYQLISADRDISFFVQNDDAAANAFTIIVDTSADAILSETPSGTAEIDSSQIIDHGNGWYCLEVVATCDPDGDDTDDFDIFLRCALPGGTITYTGDGASGFNFYELLIEPFGQAPPYIAVTHRKAEDMSKRPRMPKPRKTFRGKFE